MKELSFLQILKKKMITPVFQPIVSLRDGSILGYEALSRGPAGTFASPIALFEAANTHDKLWKLEQICRTKALEAANTLQIKGTLFLNVNPNVMQDPKFKTGFTKSYLENYDYTADTIVFEITEREAIDNIADFRKTVDNYKAQAYRIAIDDAGAGYSGLNMISDVRPHFIKLDMQLIRNIDSDATKHSLVKSMCDFASMSNTLLIAEGIETEGELLKLIDLGVHYGQGYFIQRPAEIPEPLTEDFLTIVQNANAKRSNMPGVRISDVTIQSICTALPTLHTKTTITDVHKMLRDNTYLPGYCITTNNELAGVITRHQVHAKMSGQYGYSLYAKRPIKQIMHTSFLAVAHNTPIDEVAKQAMARTADQLYDFITVTKDGQYLGIVTVKDLLEKTIQIEIDNAKHLNPLTELPGNILIERELEQCLHLQKDYAVLYFDLDNFKPFNDVYGFEKGDLIIKLVATIMKTNIAKEYFIGHIGGDDFIAIVESAGVDKLCQTMLTMFDEAVPQFYSDEDVARGFVTTKNRHGIEEQYPLLTLSIAGIINEYFSTTYAIAEQATALKKRCKQRAGSNFISTHHLAMLS